MRKRILALALALLCLGSMAFAAGGAPVRVIIIPPAALTPGHLVDGAGAIFASFVYDWLFRINGQTGKVEPSLVESYTTSPDAKVWTMKLRKGIKFHHGTVFSADDVVYTVNRWLDKKLGMAPYGVFNGLVQKVDKIDASTVRFTLTQTDVEFYLKFLDYNTPMTAHDYDNDNLGETKPSGTGAFLVDSLVPKERVEFKANKGYWVNGAPAVDSVELLFIPDTETEIKMMEAGQADVVTDLSVDQYKRLNANPNTTGLFIKLGHHVAVSMRTDMPPFNDLRVRQAMKLVVDRQKMLDTVMFGMGSPGNDTPIAPFNPFYDDLGGIRQRDVEKAKALLAEAGYTDKKPLSVTLYCSSNTPPELDVALTYQQMAKDAGIDVEISTSPRDVYYAKHWLQETFTATLWGHREDVTQLLRLAYMSKGPWNEGHYANPELDKNIQLATSTTDVAKRKEYFKNIQQILHDDGPTIISFFQPYFGATSKRITDFYLTRNWINDYRFIKLASQ
ncbi:MAG TPA: ABC transporter substrate-binding protein [Spirochaetia bacterium]|nr:ABC transporter substrate-binding protein [Spirochaetia bacterium]